MEKTSVLAKLKQGRRNPHLPLYMIIIGGKYTDFQRFI